MDVRVDVDVDVDVAVALANSEMGAEMDVDGYCSISSVQFKFRGIWGIVGINVDWGGVLGDAGLELGII